MKSPLFLQKQFLMLFLCLFILKANGQQKFDKSKLEWAEINKLKAKVEADPSNPKLHEAFIEAYNSDDPALEAVYKTWMQKFPKTFAVPFEIGKTYVDRENPKATPFLLQASVLKPDNSEVWNLLAQDAVIRNDVANEKVYLRKAIQLAPKNPEYAFNYASSFKDTDPEKYDSLSLDIARKFPDNEVGVIALSLLAQKTSVPEEKIAYFKQIFNRKAIHKSDWYVGAMEQYFDMLLQTNPGQAFELGTSIILDNNLYLDLWHERLIVADAFLRAKELLTSGTPQEATVLLNKVRLRNAVMGRVIDAGEYLKIFKAQALDSARLYRAAYDTLAIFYSQKPSETLQPALYRYGKQNGMDTAAVMQDIAQKRSNVAKQATEFSLKNYTDGASKSLSDYRGKVVLLTYWFPGCGPCRAEFPHFEAVLKKFGKDSVAYLGLNIQPMQDDAVLPFLKESGYSFKPLHDNSARNKGNLDNENSAPVNFLIDRKGRIVFSKFRIDADNEKTLELMIRETLAEKEE